MEKLEKYEFDKKSLERVQGNKNKRVSILNQLKEYLEWEKEQNYNLYKMFNEEKKEKIANEYWNKYQQVIEILDFILGKKYRKLCIELMNKYPIDNK